MSTCNVQRATCRFTVSWLLHSAVSQTVIQASSHPVSQSVSEKRMHYKGHQVRILSFVCNKEKRIQSPAQNKCFFVELRSGRGCSSVRDRDAESKLAKKLNYMQASYGFHAPWPMPHPTTTTYLPQVTAGAKLL